MKLAAKSADVLRRQKDGIWRFVIDNPWGTDWSHAVGFQNLGTLFDDFFQNLLPSGLRFFKTIPPSPDRARDASALGRHQVVKPVLKVISGFAFATICA
jgi:hypothetical protein